MNRKFVLPLFLLVLLLLMGCAPAGYQEAASDIASPQMESNYGGEAFPEESVGVSNGKSIADSTGANQIERIVIKNASISIVVDDPAEVMDTIGRMAEESGGFIVSSNLYRRQTNQGLEIPGAEITIRVPAELLVETLDEIKALLNDPVKDILQENTSGEDVTSEYTDLQSRLKNLEEASLKLEEIMDDAQETEDVLDVYNELTRINEQIEVLKGKIQYYNEASRLSSISVNINARESIRELSIGGWEPAGIARDAIQALINTLEYLAGAAIWIGLYILPVGLCIIIPIFLVFIGVRAISRRRKAARKQTADAATTYPEETDTGS